MGLISPARHFSDITSILAESTFADDTILRDVTWNDAPLARIEWSKLRQLGDEQALRVAVGRQARIRACRDAVRAYNGLASALKAQGITRPASCFGYVSSVSNAARCV